MNCLYIDTHDKDINLIIYKDGKILKECLKTDVKQQSEIMINSIDELINSAKITLNDIDEICVVNGPGLFTSIRIGVTVAKTLAYSLKINIKTVTYLELLGIQIESNNKIIEMPEKNGHFIAEYKDNVITNMFYLSKSEYTTYKENHEVYENISINYDNLYNYIKNIEPTNVYDANPIYIKSIGV